eukprot:SAG11_NODE_3108_length_2682_cov_70.794038_1_plen_212_part_00
MEPAGIDGGHPVTNCDASDLNAGDSEQNMGTSAYSTSPGRSTPSSTFTTGSSTASPSHATRSPSIATRGSADREGVQAILTGPTSSDAPPLGDACYGGAQGLRREASVVSHGLSPSTSEVGPVGDLLSSCVVTPIVERPGNVSKVGIDEMNESHLRPLPRTDPQEALSADSRSVLPSAGAGPIDASPASGSDRPRSRAGPHGDMRGGTCAA